VKPFCTIAFLIAFSFISPAQNTLPLPIPHVPGWLVTDSARYTASNLYGYVDGGAELYLEYGCEQAGVYRMDCEGHELVVEIWQLHDANGAFGVFSVSGTDCKRIDTLLVRHCFNEQRLMLQHANYYITITGDLSLEMVMNAAIRLSRSIAARIGKDDFQVPEFFAKNNWFVKEPRPLRMYAGPVALQNNYPNIAERCSDIGRFNFAVMEIPWNSVTVTLLLASLPSDEALNKCASRFSFRPSENNIGTWNPSSEPGIAAILQLSSNECAVLLSDTEIPNLKELQDLLSPGLRK
jgi:hypothetical protein